MFLFVSHFILLGGKPLPVECIGADPDNTVPKQGQMFGNGCVNLDLSIVDTTWQLPTLTS